MAASEQYELVEAIESDVERLVVDHLLRRPHRYFHEYIPWEKGLSFGDTPWDEFQCTLNEQARIALALNLLTEDNLPSYHSHLETKLPDNSIWKRWSGIWTAEEGQHATAIRAYLLTSRTANLRSASAGYPNTRHS